MSRDRAVTTVRENLVELDNPVTLEIAGDRAVAAERLTNAGIAVAEHVSFTLAEPGPALEFLRAYSPCVVKPARSTGGGAGITCGVGTPEELVRAALTAVAFCPDLVIERQLSGVELRLMVLDGTVAAAVRRERPSVVGDGVSTVTELLMAENRRRLAAAGQEGLFLLELTVDAGLALRRQGFSPRSVPSPGQAVVVAGKVNAGGPAECVTYEPAPALAADVASAARALGLRWASVEVACDDPEKGLAGGGGVIEVNSTPGLSYHYQVRDPSTVRPVAEEVLTCLLREAADTRRRLRRVAVSDPASPPSRGTGDGGRSAATGA
jgi:cyanophycin synthetase